jgi:hypothetical protein
VTASSLQKKLSGEIKRIIQRSCRFKVKVSLNGIFFSAVLIAFISCHNNKQEITFSDEIAPIIYKNCTPCHRDDNAGPFNLVTYPEIKAKAKTIAFVAGSRYMPPWPADVNYRHFAGEKYLTDNEIALIKKWADEGAPAGDTSKMPDPPVFHYSQTLGKPDMVLKMPEKIFLKGDMQDHFMVMKLPYNIESDTFVRAIEFVPGNKKLLHHMNAHFVQYDFPEKKKDPYEGSWVVNHEIFKSHEIHKNLGLLYDDGTYPRLVPSVCNYLPGVETTIFPEGIGGYVIRKKGAIYLNDIHYGPSGTDQYDQSYFNIYFSKEPPKRPVREFQMGTLGISPVVPPLAVPPDSVKTFYTSLQIKQPVSLLTVTPHMHLLGKTFLAYAITPAGDTIPLVRIPKWDFRWQYFYKFKNLLPLPSGTVIYVEGTYDNTSKNPNNPYFPPRLIIERNGSMRTTDEMFQLIIQYIPYQQGDENIKL